MNQFHYLLKDVIDNGIDSGDRTGTGTLSVFGRQTRYDLSKGFPLLTTKRTYWKGVLIELLWLMRGETNVKFLQERGITIWDEWSLPNGDLGPVYGEQWRKWQYLDEDDFINTDNDDDLLVGGRGMYYKKETVDQLTNVIERIKTNPNCRRLIVSAWNSPLIPKMKLPPCHAFFQFYVRNGKLSCQLYQRSADIFLGVPFNIASYANLTYLVANECGLEVGEFVHTFGDLHLYKNHIDQAKELLTRTEFPLPQLEINIPKGELMNFIDNQVHILSWEEIQQKITLKNYQYHATIKAEVSV